MRTTLLIAPAIAAFALIGGCQNSGEKATTEKAKKPDAVMAGDLNGKSPMDIWPSKVGAQTTYDATINGKPAVLTFKVTKVKPAGKNGQDISFEIFNSAQPDKPTDNPVWRLDEDGLSQVSARQGLTFTPPQFLVHFPIKFGEQYDYKGKGPFPLGKGSGDLTGKTRVRGQEVVQTDMGDIEAIAVESIYGWKAENMIFRSTETAWIAPNYGLVRYQQTIQYQNEKMETGSQSQSLVLKSYSSP